MLRDSFQHQHQVLRGNFFLNCDATNMLRNPPPFLIIAEVCNQGTISLTLSRAFVATLQAKMAVHGRQCGRAQGF